MRVTRRLAWSSLDICNTLVPGHRKMNLWSLERLKNHLRFVASSFLRRMRFRVFPCICSWESSVRFAGTTGRGRDRVREGT